MNASTGSPTYVLGVHPGVHDATAVLLRDGELVAMVEQERLSRNRRAIRESPSEAVAACLRQAGIDRDALAEIAIGVDIPAWERLEDSAVTDITGGQDLREWLGGHPSGGRFPPLRYVDHHIAHAASALHTSGWDTAAILTVDGKGESVATTIGAGSSDNIEVLRTWGANQSLGNLYTCASRWAGLGMWGAGKLMGLASYGSACQPAPLTVDGNGYAIDGAPPPDMRPSAQLRKLTGSLLDSFRKRNYPFCDGEPADAMAYANFAASIQAALEEAILSLARMARRETEQSRLVLAGGVALNCTANGALVRSGIFDEVWVPPFPYDAGVSIGAALVADRAIRGSATVPARLPHAFWAPETSGPEDEALAKLKGCEVERLGEVELAEAVAQHIDEGKLVGWWQGRAEVGQRALGGRSILCDPRSRRSLVHANKVKGREIWRPLAPAVLAEHAGELFDGTLPAAAEFMLAAWPVRERAQPRIPAAVHVDGSARPQVVRPEQRRYHDAISAFRERTGVPAVINTSFNLAGEPIVLTPHDAVDTFLRSDLDVLVLDDIVAHKPK